MSASCIYKIGETIFLLALQLVEAWHREEVKEKGGKFEDLDAAIE